MSGPGKLLTKEQFESGFIAFDEPYFECGVKLLPRRNDVVVHGDLDAARNAVDQMPVLKASGAYGIVRRLVFDPDNWELVRD